MSLVKSLDEKYREWKNKSTENVKKWGIQDLKDLSLASMEELGELTQAILQYFHESGKFDRIQEELDDLIPLMFQIQLRINYLNTKGA